MKIRYPHASIALAAAVLLAGTSVMHAYAEADISNADTAAEESSSALWKAEISDYDSSLSLLQYEEVEPTEEDSTSVETVEEDASESTQQTQTLASSGTTGSTDAGAAAALGSPESGQIAFTTYGYGHCVGMSQNGANYYASYGGYDYQSILFHYYPGTTLVQESTSGTITVNGVTGSLLEMISQIVYAEMSPSMHTEALKAQAVAAYSYVMYNGGSISGAAVKADPPQTIIDAVSSVLGQALYYNGDYAMTLYTASSGGATASAADIFGTAYAYLVSVPSEYDAQYDPYYGEVTYLSVEEVRSRIENAYGITLSSNASNWMQLTIGDSGYVRSVNIDGQKTVSGDAFSSVLGLKSARFAYIFG